MKQTLLLCVVLAVLLALALWGAGTIWFNGNEVELGLHGSLALIAAVVAILGIGGGLMALSFFSARRGFDDEIGQ